MTRNCKNKKDGFILTFLNILPMGRKKGDELPIRKNNSDFGLQENKLTVWSSNINICYNLLVKMKKRKIIDCTINDMM